MASISKRTWTRDDGTKGVGYVVWFKDRSGKRKARQFQKRKEAVEFAEQVQEHRKRYERNAVPPKLTVRLAAEDWLKACEKGRGEKGPLEAHSIRAYSSQVDLHINPRLGDVRVAELEKADVEKLRQQLLDTLSRPMARKVLFTLTALLQHALGDGDNPAKGVTVRIDSRHRERVDIPEPGEVRAVLLKATEWAEDMKKPERSRRAWQRYRAILYTLVFTGMRLGELRGLPRSNVDLKDCLIKIDQKADESGIIGPPKSASSRRTVEIPDVLVGILRNWLLMAPVPKDKDGKPRAVKPTENFVFPNWEGNVESTTNLHTRFWRPLQIACGLYAEEPVLDEQGKPVLEKNGGPKVRKVPRYNLHSLRHYHASEQIRNGATALEVRNRLGHASTQITLDIYGHLFEEDLEQRRARQNQMARRLLEV